MHGLEYNIDLIDTWFYITIYVICIAYTAAWIVFAMPNEMDENVNFLMDIKAWTNLVQI